MPRSLLIALLAAGTSRRMGRPKQLLAWKGKSLVKHIADIAVQSGVGELGVVLGAERERVKNELEGLDWLPIESPNFLEGQGSSIKAAVKAATQKNLDGILFLAVDQPLLSSSDLKRVARPFLSGESEIVASFYADTYGIPALFSKVFFDDLLALTPEQGAKSILRKNEKNLSLVSVPAAEKDLDTFEDYLALSDEVTRPIDIP